MKQQNCFIAYFFLDTLRSDGLLSARDRTMMESKCVKTGREGATMAKQHIHTQQELEDQLKNDKVLIFKHSSTCPISAEAFVQYEKFTEEHPELTSLYLVVQEDKELSNSIADTYHVKHQSPQAILFKNGDVAWHESHWRITVDSLTKALEE
ncbi:bacillithiol system redox-active protein YtxJ [Bacillus testis]|uniref:bacillithiol system redox-active protein YtxJ n=1 Tax=Bacillus testis TaxID=1622072 RepID=UPI000AC5D1E5|nr:bacillithiol system redox-active protein YtxJ [Bacillus testis]